MASQVTIKGLDKTLRKLSHPAHIAAAKRGLQAGAVHIKGKTAKYPPSTAANSASQPRWYERGYGPRWHRADGSIGGRKTSETLGRKWTTASRNAGLTQVIGNNVSYGEPVQSKEKQARFHKQRGWIPIDDTAEDEGPVVVKFVKAQIDSVLEE